MHKRLTREQLDELLPKFQEIALITCDAPHLALFVMASFVAKYELDSVAIGQIHKAASLDSPLECDMETRLLHHELIDGGIYLNNAEMTLFYADMGFKKAAEFLARIEFEDTGGSDGEDDEDDGQD